MREAKEGGASWPGIGKVVGIEEVREESGPPALRSGGNGTEPGMGGGPYTGAGQCAEERRLA
jgi:hypothetical protein